MSRKVLGQSALTEGKRKENFSWLHGFELETLSKRFTVAISTSLTIVTRGAFIFEHKTALKRLSVIAIPHEITSKFYPSPRPSDSRVLTTSELLRQNVHAASYYTPAI
jgi:hypothetical protein